MLGSLLRGYGARRWENRGAKEKIKTTTKISVKKNKEDGVELTAETRKPVVNVREFAESVILVITTHRR